MTEVKDDGLNVYDIAVGLQFKAADKEERDFFVSILIEILTEFLNDIDSVRKSYKNALDYKEPEGIM